MDCIKIFRILFLIKKTFKLIWEKIRTFEVLCVDFIKEISIWISFIFCVRKLSLHKGLKCKFSKSIWFGDISKVHYILNRRSVVQLSTKQACCKQLWQIRLFP